MSFIENIIARAGQNKKTIVLFEGNDERILQAAECITTQGFANLIIIGDEQDIRARGYNPDAYTVINHETSPLRGEFIEKLVEIRKSKGLTAEEADNLLHKPEYFATMLVKTGRADGMVGGICHTTADVLRPALQIIKTKPGVSLVSSFFIIIVPDCAYGEPYENSGVFFFSDCGLEVSPTAEKLANIGVSAAESWKRLMETEPRVAFLSHSSYGSAKNDDAAKVREAVVRAHELAPELSLDGELQLDAAIVPEVAQAKAPQSSVAGKANILVFPDLDAGNIGYKLVHRLAKAQAYGPITQGIAAPINDLSRGCSAQDVVGVVALTCLQA